LEKKINQPFKQVFRELYLKTAEEQALPHCLRYSGVRILPKKMAGALKACRWVADAEEGLQKVCYENDVAANIHVLADWFNPADTAAPTVEYVAFYERISGRPLPLNEVPDIIFSEVIRDIDLLLGIAGSKS
ncbi:MAG: DUF4132 domain-containing protein, partial [Tannerellaceae bacterium]|nr:DUF4132 domain-containing protein [Tannerellaceae bacterium]